MASYLQLPMKTPRRASTLAIRCLVDFSRARRENHGHLLAVELLYAATDWARLSVGACEDGESTSLRPLLW